MDNDKLIIGPLATTEQIHVTIEHFTIVVTAYNIMKIENMW